MTHTLTVKKVPSEADDNVEYTVGGEHDRSCETYFICDQCQDDESITAEIMDDWAADGEWMRHGRTHIESEGGDIMVLHKNYCALREHPDLSLLVEQLGVGTHDVEVDYWGDGRWEIMGYGSKGEVVYP